MFSFFSRKKVDPNLDFSAVSVDMHSHLLPGIDDGSPDLPSTKFLLEGLMDLGFRHFITTPHVMEGIHPNTSSGIKDKLQLVKSELAAWDIHTQFYASAEYNMDEGFERLLLNMDFIPFPGKPYLLFEMSFLEKYPRMHEIVFSLHTKGYFPILAHPERFPYLAKNFDQYRKIQDMGCKLQANILSFAGYYGKPTRETAEKLAKEGLIQMIGTDCHHEKHLGPLREALRNKYLVKLMESGNLLNPTLL